MDNKKLTTSHLHYVDTLCKELVATLHEVLVDSDSPQRARFNRLRIELGKILLIISKIMYRSL